MIGLDSLFAVAGVGIAAELIGMVLENIGQGNKVVFVRIASYVVCGFIAWDVWWDGINYVASKFGVSL